jgi:hypothetical protein
MHVKAPSLNLRHTPLVKPETLIVSLPFGHPVDVQGDADRPGWKVVSTTYKGVVHHGVISGDFLRAPLSAAKENLLAAAAVEWDRFKRGEGKETVSPFDGFVGEMWQALGLGLDGDDTGQPWSAACISFIVRKAGYTKFKFATAHAVYINEAIVARQNNQARDYWGFRLNEHKPQIGDLICRKRTSAAINFDFAATHSEFKSHTDIVVAMEDGKVATVGGNVSNSVSITRYALTATGHVSADGGRVFAILRNNN